jgi:hypothetical protein
VAAWSNGIISAWEHVGRAIESGKVLGGSELNGYHYGVLSTSKVVFWGKRPLVPLLLLGLPFFSDYSFRSTTLLTGMTGISLHISTSKVLYPQKHM